MLVMKSGNSRILSVPPKPSQSGASTRKRSASGPMLRSQLASAQSPGAPP